MSMEHGQDPDAYWRRPPDGGSAEAGQPAGRPASGLGGATTPVEPAGQPGPGYSGPPPSTPPPPDWHTPVYVEPPEPRRLPPQDPAALDAEEQSARTLTNGIALVATAVLVVVVCLLCSRVLF